MKKGLKRLLIVLIILILLIAGLYSLISGKSQFNSAYLVPANAVMIIESDEPIEAWNAIVNSDAWYHLSQIESLAELNEDILSADSLIESNKTLLNIFGARKILVSVHELPSGKFDYLYLIDVGKAARLKNLETHIDKFLGDDFSSTIREYNDQKIVELYDSESGEMYYFTLMKDKMIMSFNYKLVEASIDELEHMTIGRDNKFIDVRKRSRGHGLFSIYLQHKYLDDYYKYLVGESNETIKSSSKTSHYTGFSFDIDQEGMITIEGYISLNDTVPSTLAAMLQGGDAEIKSAGVIPQRVASMAKINFNDAPEYVDNALRSMGEEDYQEYKESQQKLEKKLKINLENNLLDWMDEEIVLLQTQPSNLGRTNEFAAIVKAKKEKDARENMAFINQQIKKNTPVKVKQVEYEEFTINYIAFPGILKALFGKMLDKIEKPYYVQIEDQVIFSNHPQTLKNIIDDYKADNTMARSINYYNFSKNFNNKTSLFSYLDIPVLFNNLKAFVDTDTWSNLNKNKEYITSFSQAGIQMDDEDEVIHFVLKARYNRQVEQFTKQRYNTQQIVNAFMESLSTIPVDSTSPEEGLPDIQASKIIISDLDAGKHEVFFNDGELKLSCGLKDGLKHGTFKEYYENGQLKVRGKYKNDEKIGTWKYYNEEGEMVKEEMWD